MVSPRRLRAGRPRSAKRSQPEKASAVDMASLDNGVGENPDPVDLELDQVPDRQPPIQLHSTPAADRPAADNVAGVKILGLRQVDERLGEAEAHRPHPTL